MEKTEKEELLILFREAGENGDYCIHLPSTNGYLLDLTNGELQYLCKLLPTPSDLIFRRFLPKTKKTEEKNDQKTYF